MEIFLYSIKSHIHLKPEQWICLQCEGDWIIMENAGNLHGIKPIELVYTQCIHVYLNVSTLADITTSNGKEICD